MVLHDGLCIIFSISEAKETLALSLLPVVFKGRVKGGKGKCGFSAFLAAFLDFQHVSFYDHCFSVITLSFCVEVTSANIVYFRIAVKQMKVNTKKEKKEKEL